MTYNPDRYFLRRKQQHKRTDQRNNFQTVSRCFDGDPEDILTPDQYIKDRESASVWTRAFYKYHKLWTACLYDAYTVLMEGKEPMRRKEELWFKSSRYRVGSFVWICRHLDLDPKAIRERVLK